MVASVGQFEQGKEFAAQRVVLQERTAHHAVHHLGPVILTGLPRGNWAADQKVRWAAKHFPGTRIITTMARDKRDHAREGDVLVDDQTRHRERWEEVGGVFVHHTSARESLAQLGEYFPLQTRARLGEQ